MADCPACHTTTTRSIRVQTAEGAAEHFVPRARFPERNAALVSHLRSMWGAGEATIATCSQCGFGFSDPFIGGDERFYELVHNADPHYPADRWEFGQTLQALQAQAGRTLLEVGAGKGAFIDRLPGGYEVTAADFDHGAVATMRAKGIDAHVGSLEDMVDRGPFDIVCMFQTLEHMADLDRVFTTLREAVIPGGSIFLSVPNGEWTEVQERLSAFMDMPPNHVGRWTAEAFRAVSNRNGLQVVEQRTQEVAKLSQAWLLARYRVNAIAFSPGTVAHRVQSLKFRPLRGMLKAGLAMLVLPGMLAASPKFVTPVRWAHLSRPAGR